MVLGTDGRWLKAPTRCATKPTLSRLVRADPVQRVASADVAQFK